MAKKKVFVSFDYDEDRHYKSLLQAWDANKNFDFNFNDQSVITPIDSNESSRIKAGITNKMKKSTYCLIIVGEHAHKSEWISWEIENAHNLGLELVAVKIDKKYKSPENISGKNVSWAMSFKEKSIINAMRKHSQKNTVYSHRKNTENSQRKKTKTREGIACKRCGRLLTNSASISRGYGSFCYGKI